MFVSVFCFIQDWKTLWNTSASSLCFLLFFLCVCVFVLFCFVFVCFLSRTGRLHGVPGQVLRVFGCFWLFCCVFTQDRETSWSTSASSSCFLLLLLLLGFFRLFVLFLFLSRTGTLHRIPQLVPRVFCWFCLVWFGLVYIFIQDWKTSWSTSASSSCFLLVLFCFVFVFIQDWNTSWSTSASSSVFFFVLFYFSPGLEDFVEYLGRFCGQDTPGFVSTQPGLCLVFRSDATLHGRGWLLSYRAGPAGPAVTPYDSE